MKQPKRPRILLLDIETMYTTVGTFGLHNQNHGVEQILKDGGVICWAAKWLGHRKILSDAIWAYDEDLPGEEMIAKSMHYLMNQADIIIGHNADGFDIKWLNKLFMKNDLSPISVYKTIDTLTACKKHFYFISYTLKNIARELKLKHQKIETGGFSLWKDCINDIKKAQDKMIKYNKHDVLVLEDLYTKIRPYITNHPNMNLYSDRPVCRTCGSSRLRVNGECYKQSVVYQRYVCLVCGVEMRHGKILRKLNIVPIKPGKERK